MVSRGEPMNDPFGPQPPKDDHQILRDLWLSMDQILTVRLPRIEMQCEKTNGRVTALEKFRYAAGGGLAVITVVVVPLFVKAVAG